MCVHSPWLKNNPTDDTFRRRFTPEQMDANEALEVKIKFSIEGDRNESTQTDQ